MNEAEADRRLRALFHQAGPLQAPEGLEERVLRALGPAPMPAPMSIEPLLPRWTWPSIGLLLAALGLAAMVGGPVEVEAMGALPKWLPDMELPSLHLMLTHTALRMGMLAMLCFAALELYLSRRRGVKVRVR